MRSRENKLLCRLVRAQRTQAPTFTALDVCMQAAEGPARPLPKASAASTTPGKGPGCSDPTTGMPTGTTTGACALLLPSHQRSC